MSKNFWLEKYKFTFTKTETKETKRSQRTNKILRRNPGNSRVTGTKKRVFPFCARNIQLDSHALSPLGICLHIFFTFLSREQFSMQCKPNNVLANATWSSGANYHSPDATCSLSGLYNPTSLSHQIWAAWGACDLQEGSYLQLRQVKKVVIAPGVC